MMAALKKDTAKKKPLSKKAGKAIASNKKAAKAKAIQKPAKVSNTGRPVEFTEELQLIAWQYIDDYKSYDHAMPSVVGLCKVINRAKSTIYKWASRDDNEFLDILAGIKEAQELCLMNNGLTGAYNSNIVKLALGKHGYHDKIDSNIDAKVEPKAFGDMYAGKDKA